MGWRTHELMQYFKAYDGILKGKKSFPKVEFRAVVGPHHSLKLNVHDAISNPLSLLIPIDYNSASVAQQMARGKKDAQEALMQGNKFTEKAIASFSRKYSEIAAKI